MCIGIKDDKYKSCFMFIEAKHARKLTILWFYLDTTSSARVSATSSKSSYV